jgi:SAM-dependent methyltransferase
MDSTAWDQRYADRELVWGAPPNRYVVEHAGALAPGRALDLACGEGRNAIWLATRGWQVTGSDFSAVALGKAAQVAAGAPRSVGARLTWRHADAVTDELGGPYDLVLHVYLHLAAAARTAVLSRACAALAPGGTLLVVAHDGTNLTDGTGGPQDPDVLYTPADVVAALPVDMTVQVAQTPRREVPGAARAAIDCLVLARRGSETTPRQPPKTRS